MQPRSWVRSLLIVTACALIAAPISFVATFMLMPVWSWYERATAIESVGHSGPATWCFVVVYVVLVAALYTGQRAVLSRRPRKTTADRGSHG